METVTLTQAAYEETNNKMNFQFTHLLRYDDLMILYKMLPMMTLMMLPITILMMPPTFLVTLPIILLFFLVAAAVDQQYLEAIKLISILKLKWAMLTCMGSPDMAVLTILGYMV